MLLAFATARYEGGGGVLVSGLYSGGRMVSARVVSTHPAPYW